MAGSLVTKLVAVSIETVGTEGTPKFGYCYSQH